MQSGEVHFPDLFLSFWLQGALCVCISLCLCIFGRKGNLQSAEVRYDDHVSENEEERRKVYLWVSFTQCSLVRE